MHKGVRVGTGHYSSVLISPTIVLCKLELQIFHLVFNLNVHIKSECKINLNEIYSYIYIKKHINLSKAYVSMNIACMATVMCEWAEKVYTVAQLNHQLVKINSNRQCGEVI